MKLLVCHWWEIQDRIGRFSCMFWADLLGKYVKWIWTVLFFPHSQGCQVPEKFPAEGKLKRKTPERNETYPNLYKQYTVLSFHFPNAFNTYICSWHLIERTSIKIINVMLLKSLDQLINTEIHKRKCYAFCPMRVVVSSQWLTLPC